MVLLKLNYRYKKIHFKKILGKRNILQNTNRAPRKVFQAELGDGEIYKKGKQITFN